MSKFKNYLISIGIPVILGGLIGLIISPFIDYSSLQKPPFAPQSIVFPIVWTILYIIMGVSYGILKNENKIEKDVNRIYYLQLFFNYLWPIAFFILKWRLFSAIWIMILAVLIIIMIFKFYSRNKIAGLLQIPYLLWTLFATYLNVGVYILNL